MGKMEKKFHEQQGRHQPSQPKTRVGETSIDKKPNSNNSSNNTVGEYVDYEDVD